MSLILGRPQSLASWQIESATPIEVDTDWYWTSVRISQIDDHIRAISDKLRANTYLSNAEVARLESQRAGLNEEWEVLEDHRIQLDAEYGRRAWSRAWLVVSSDGHIHKAPFCTTFQRNTRCTLLPQASGMTHDEIVDAAGEKACTVCFPGAPVKPCTLIDPLTAQEQDEREIEKAAKARVAAGKAITTPEGAPLYTATTKASGGFRDQDLIKTEIAAQRRATSTLKDLGWYGLGCDDTAADIETFRRVIYALAAKQNHAVGVLVEEYFDRASKAVKREGGKMLISWATVSTWF